MVPHRGGSTGPPDPPGPQASGPGGNNGEWAPTGPPSRPILHYFRDSATPDVAGLTSRAHAAPLLLPPLALPLLPVVTVRVKEFWKPIAPHISNSSAALGSGAVREVLNALGGGTRIGRSGSLTPWPCICTVAAAVAAAVAAGCCSWLLQLERRWRERREGLRAEPEPSLHHRCAQAR